VGLPPRRSVVLSNGSLLELALVPAAEFRMGAPIPEKPGEPVDQSYWALVLSVCVFAGLLAVILLRACRLRRRFQFSLAYLVLMTVSASCFVGTATHSWLLAEQWKEYERRLAQSWAVEESQKPPHWVTLSRPFYLSVTEISREQYAAVCDSARLPGHVPVRGNPDVIPVLVKFDEARTFCDQLRERHDLAFRLPTEAEHEFAGTIGAKVAFCTHRHDAKRMDCLAHFGKIPPLHQVGTGKPNALGLRDLRANAWEWCSDWYGPYRETAVRDPHGVSIGRARVVRGVDRVTTDEGCVPSCRWSQSPRRVAGIRLALDVRDVATVCAEERKTDEVLAKRWLHEKLQFAPREIENCIVNMKYHEVMDWVEGPKCPKRFCVLRQQLRHFESDAVITCVDAAVLDSVEEARELFRCRAQGTRGFWAADLDVLGDESCYTYGGTWRGLKDRIRSEVYLRRGRLYLHVYSISRGVESVPATHYRNVCETILIKYEALDRPGLARTSSR